VHELVHVKQYREIGFFKFLYRYVKEYYEKGYSGFLLNRKPITYSMNLWVWIRNEYRKF
jgi:hypothetical protein